MNIKNRLMPYLMQAITSDALRDGKRSLGALSVKRHMARFYFRADDPYSYLLAQQLPDFCRHFGFTIEPRVMLGVPESLYPEPQLYTAWSLKDAAYCAQLHGLRFPENAKLPERETLVAATRVLLSYENDVDFLVVANAVGRSLWRGHHEAIRQLADGEGMLSEKKALSLMQQRKLNLLKEGHYLTGTLRYGGEWYWGPDRLDHLALRLAARHGNVPDVASFTRWRELALRPGVHARGETLEFFFSFRSPYSYLALERVYRLSRHYQINLQMRPVLPMVMRGLSVPNAKRMYIVMDARREAQMAHLPFGRICDPVGAGVERCMALWPFAEQQGKLEAFLLRAAQAIWSEGADVARDDHLRRIVADAGLDWHAARAALSDGRWRERAEANRIDMLAAGNWGVPGFRFRGEMFWGQDRITALEQRILSSASRLAQA